MSRAIFCRFPSKLGLLFPKKSFLLRRQEPRLDGVHLLQHGLSGLLVAEMELPGPDEKLRQRAPFFRDSFLRIVERGPQSNSVFYPDEASSLFGMPKARVKNANYRSRSVLLHAPMQYKYM